MKFLEGEPVAKRLLRLFTQLDNLQLAQHVRAGLAGIDDVSLDFAWLDAVVDRLLARPVLRMNAGIDNEPARAKQFRIELAKQALRIVLIPSGLSRKPFSVESPSFAQRGDAAKRADLPEARQFFVFHFECDLKVMPGNSLVVNERT